MISFDDVSITFADRATRQAVIDGDARPAPPPTLAAKPAAKPKPAKAPDPAQGDLF